ncbi:MAG: ATP-binding protein [Candidatus Zapsychrus exili]|nr:ATP-binding protein [Candidatus Zapsychrus exili]
MSSNLILNIIIFTSLAGLSAFAVFQTKSLNKSEEDLKKLKKSFDRLDEQAKLIVKTDLELNKAQEELDKRLNGLDALQQTSRSMSTTLDENEIFNRLDKSLVIGLGFEKNIILIQDKNKKFISRIKLGIEDENIASIISELEKSAEVLKFLNEGDTLSSATSPQDMKLSIGKIFNVEHFIISPIMTKNGMIGIMFVGNGTISSAVTEGDKEMVSILASQIGQSLENARLFEEAFRASQILDTKVKERTKQLASILEEVKYISKAKSEFISAVSHELRTPLTSIKGYASILIAGKLGEVPEQVKQRLEKINIHSDNLVQLINNLLDISRIESGRVEMSIEKCSLPDIIENVRDLLNPQMREKDINWKAEINENIPEMLLDKHQVERIFINLIGNATKFTPQNGIIGVKADYDNDTATVEVSDTGIGISKDDISRLFDEFYRVENTINQNVKGTGLGLPLAKKIIEAHDGKIWITSEIGKGTTFHFTIPIKQ